MKIKRLLNSQRFWLIFFAALLLLSTVAMLFIKNNADGSVAVISRDGVELQRIDLSEVAEPYTIRFDAPNGSYNIVLVDKNQIRIVEAGCPDKLCANQGYIKDNSKPIICLPNRLVVEILGTENSDELDAVSG